MHRGRASDSSHHIQWAIPFVGIYILPKKLSMFSLRKKITNFHPLFQLLKFTHVNWNANYTKRLKVWKYWILTSCQDPLYDDVRDCFSKLHSSGLISGWYFKDWMTPFLSLSPELISPYHLIFQALLGLLLSLFFWIGCVLEVFSIWFWAKTIFSPYPS